MPPKNKKKMSESKNIESDSEDYMGNLENSETESEIYVPNSEDNFDDDNLDDDNLDDDKNEIEDEDDDQLKEDGITIKCFALDIKNKSSNGFLPSVKVSSFLI